MDAINKAILNRIQSDFPITSRPFLTIAEELKLTEDEVLERISRLKEMGIIRRIGGNFVPWATSAHFARPKSLKIKLNFLPKSSTAIPA
jgi:hypothetical protein